MGRFSMRWLGAPRWALTSGLAALIVALAPTGSARAATLGCEDTWQRLAAWSEHEATRGLTSGALEELRALIPELETCRHGSSVPDLGEPVERWRDLAAVYFPPDEVDRVLCLMARESGGNAAARNVSSGASGLMQVMPSWAPVFGYDAADLFDPIVNLWIASQVRERQGWGAWSPYLRGACR